MEQRLAFSWGEPASVVACLDQLYHHEASITTHGPFRMASVRLLLPGAAGQILYLAADDLRLMLADYHNEQKVRVPFRDDG